MKFTFYTDDVTKLSCGLLGAPVFEEQVWRRRDLQGRRPAARRAAVTPRRRRAIQGQKGPVAVAAHARARRPAAPAPRRWRRAQGSAARPICAGSPRASSRPAPPRKRPSVAAVLPYLEGAPARRRRSAPRSSSPRARILGVYKFDRYLTGDKKKPRDRRGSEDRRHARQRRRRAPRGAQARHPARRAGRRRRGARARSRSTSPPAT